MPAPVDNPRLDGFMERWRSTPVGYEATQAQRWLKCQPSSYLKARGLWLYWVIRGGIGLTRRLGVAWQHTAPNERMDTLPRTRASQNRWATTEACNLGRSREVCATLKRLAFSIVRRRSVPPFSRVSEQWQQSYGLK